MASLILDERDQKFTLYEMLELEKLCELERYADFSKDMFDMILSEAQKFATEEIFPTLAESDKEGCRLENGQVRVPKCFHKAFKLFCEAGWNCMSLPQHVGGQGLPFIMRIAAHEWFIHNFAFVSYPGLAEGAGHLIEVYGSEEHKKKYLPKMISGEWGGSMCLTEPGAGSDVGNLSTRAVRQPDGTFRIQGTKIFITGGDQDLTENIIHPVLARIEGDPAGTKGISIFIVPKYLVNADCSLGRRNDYEIAKIEEKMGIHGSATCLINFGDNNDCYAELLGNEREGMKVMFQMMNEARIATGLQGLGSASIAYLHALQYTRERLQGSSLMEFKNPEAPRVPVIQHPDVRRMLLWMKSNVDGMRALMYYATICGDKAMSVKDPVEAEKWLGIVEILTPIVKAYCTDIGFRVTETAMQCYGGYGYCSEYPVEQFLRDEKIASIYEGTNGIQALDLVGRKMGMKKGTYFMTLLGEMGATVARYQGVEAVKDLAADVSAGVNALADMGMFFASCGKQGKFLVPVGNAYPFLMMMGKIVCAWLLFWQAGIAQEKLGALCKAKGVNAADPFALAPFLKENKDAAFYDGKVKSAKYFIKNVLPEVDAVVKAIKSEDLSMMEIADEGF
ncbi:MAG TPA: acyl-CoA dehydrogenase [Deltaproteobacteria bacterium]|nr:acyl-CoA dehydrogenase [Deltaproteobacteria bacterium]HNS89881.1 acyl-CoA dehydrogenase [Deltaproteobacteria bacterium]HOC75785.1 acyl-CoA dehydrogenase [Deltaproteobacteria bacterium]HOG84502.1 acyl-CoA dehydrogenase [Deltaproteobacteria bacterium]HQM72043.1 acyl-CoA dehydrogenase [Deltaproteobacteria bacterium]